MKIFKRIREFFRRLKIKKLDKPKEVEFEVQSYKKDDLEYARNVEIPELSDEQKLESILKMIGCEQTTIDKVLKSENIDIANLRANIQILNKLKCSNIELSIIIANNTDVLTMPADDLDAIINELIKYFDDLNIVKELAYANSKVLGKTGMKRLLSVKNIFKNYDISLKEDYDLLVENSNILVMDEDRLEESLSAIKAYTNSYDKLKSLIKMEPIIIGVTNTNLLSEYV